ncbi:DUF4214 domain-containing protein [Massilia consociata]|uniref:DUF4214 domain-containing protein n=1 Tax=Massilia consociata TaxID=760117 RepID=A0ABV6FLD6_9BURK
MSDTTAPVLLELTLPATIDLSSGSVSIPVSVRAQDEPGGSGVNIVTVEFEERFWGFNRNTNFLRFDRWSSDNFHDDTPTFAAGTLQVSNLTQPGSYDVARVMVTDMAGNRTAYDTAQLQAAGIRTSITVTGGIQDTTAPTLVSLNLPSSVDLSTGFSQFIYPTGTARDTGGAGVYAVWVAFDKPLILDSGPSDGLYLSPLGRVEDNSDSYFRAMPALSAKTPAGIYKVTGVLVTDYLNNAYNYSPAQLQAMGINTAITITGSTTAPPPPVLPTAALSLSMVEQGAVLTVTPESWGSAAVTNFGLALRYNGNSDRIAGVTLTGGATGEISVVRDNDIVTITGKNITGAGAGTGIAVTMSPEEDNAPTSFGFMGFTINGIEHRHTGAEPSVDYHRGSDAADRIDYAVLPDLVDGRGGLDTLRVHGQRSDYQIAKSGNGAVLTPLYKTGTQLMNVERIEFDNGGLALDTDGAAGQLYRLYQAAFDRVPDLVGIGYWLARMDAGVSLAQVAEAFVASEEFGDLVPSGAGAQDFVTAMYDNVLHREPDPTGLAFWIDSLGRGLSRAEVLVYFSESPENVAQVVGVIQNGIDFLPWA